jgi:uracil DNA glycosylase
MDGYWKSDNFKEIITQLHEFSDKDRHFVPKRRDIFRWMMECPYDKVKCVLFIDDNRNFIGIPGIPYSQEYENMSKSKSNRAYFNKGMKENKSEDIEQFIRRLKRSEEDEFNYDLSGWCNQGVLMIPYSVTHRVGLLSKIHADMWKEFRARLIEEVGYSYPDIPWVLVNPNTYRYRELINSEHILNVKIDNARSENNYWPFWINNLLKEAGKEPIIWNREDKYPYSDEMQKMEHIKFGYSILKGYF